MGNFDPRPNRMHISATGSLHGTVIVGILARGNAVISGDSKQTHQDDPTVANIVTKIFEFPDLLVGLAGIWRSNDGTVDPLRDIRAIYKPKMPLHRLTEALKKEIASPLSDLLTRRLAEVPDKFQLEHGNAKRHAVGILLCRNSVTGPELVMIEFFPSVKGQMVLIRAVSKVQREPKSGWVHYFAIGDGGAFVNLNGSLVRALLAEGNISAAGQQAVREAISAKPATLGPPITTWEFRPTGYHRLPDTA